MKLRTLALTFATVVGIAAPAAALAQPYGYGAGYGFQGQGGYYQDTSRGHNYQRGYASPSYGGYEWGDYKRPPVRARGWDNGHQTRQNFEYRNDRRDGWSHRADRPERRH